MQPTLCSKCKKNVAVVFISRQNEKGEMVNEGLCLKCAAQLGLPQVEEMMKRMGISPEDLENINNEMMQAFGGAEELSDMPAPQDEDDEDDGESGKTATFPFLNRLFGGSNPPAEKSDAPSGREEAPKGRKADKKHKYLDSYCINLSQRARDGKLDAVIGREEEIQRVVQILNRRQKNNPCLIGEPGVGKTAIAEGLAQRIAAGDVPFKLRDKQVYLLDLTALVAGTQFRGQFESRMKGLIEEIRKLGNIILVIDEVHNIVGAGDAEGSMNAANILKPALSRGEIQVIGATTFNEYRKHIEKDTALERRFQPVTVNEPSLEDTLKILQGIAHYYENYHGVSIPQGVLRQAVVLSERYITDRFLPDKAIDLIDEACSDMNLHDPDINRRMEVKRDLENVTFERENLMSAQPAEGQEFTQEELDARYARIAQLRSQELRLQQELSALEAKGMPQLTMDNIARVIEMWTKIPASKIKEEEFKRLSQLEDRLKQHIVGQDEAVSAVSAAIRRSRVGISPKHKPVSFIFVGSTGVGKTELVKQLAADLFNTPDALIRLDMSEFMEKHSVSRLVGSPPGYVGYDEAGQLTEKIRRKPYSVILFDEIEKAHPDVLNILLQILDDGEITDAHGRKVNFENTVIVMTSNVGAKNITAAENAPLGFDGSEKQKEANEAARFARIREAVMAELKRTFKPEFLNRIDETIVFRQLTEEDIVKIAHRMLSVTGKRMAQQGITLVSDEDAVAALAKDGFDAEYGARPLRRSIQNTVEDAVAEQMLEGKLKYGDTAKVTLHDGKVVVEKIPAAEAQAEAIAEEAEEAAGEAESPAEAAEDSPDHPQSAE